MANGDPGTAERIFAAAEELFGRSGHDGVSMRDIARRAGVNKALVFYYYGNKRALFEQVVEGYYTAHQEALAEAFAEEEGTLRDRLHRVLDAYIDFINENRNYARLVQREAGQSEDNIALIQRGLLPLYEWTVKAISEIAPQKGHLAARQFFLTFSASVVNYFTYAEVLAPLWGNDPFSPAAVEERRQHLHWLVNTALDRLEAEVKVGSGA
ncbi:MAG: TetR family transcriptional regulator [Proteobacteria bacterium]|jgi:TetR/AcrR family transcriptional regulator|nr:TetR family transcriptional regulator [Pseudomonadota bacterium]